MSTGLFANVAQNNKHGARTGGRPRCAHARERMAKFADLLADGVDVPAAGRALGMTRAAANGLLSRMRQELGRQAQ